jgi:hypothetical protein
MSPAVTVFGALLIIGGGLAVMAWIMTFRLTPPERHAQTRSWLIGWTIRGIGVPFLIWGLMNFGLSWSIQPFMPKVQAALNTPGTFAPAYVRALGSGVFVICTYWAAFTLGWIAVTAAQGLSAETRPHFRALCTTCGLGLCLPAAVFVLIGGWTMAGFAATIILGPLVGYAPAVLRPKKAPPMYARAIARIKFGKYAEAEWEIIRELEKCEEDVDGWLMLAELYATKFNDLGEAQRTILDICDQPQVTAPQYSVALHRLADWQLKLGHDPKSARRSLEKIIYRYPGSHVARMAQLRINQMPETAQELQAQEQVQRIPLPALGDSLDEAAPASETEMSPHAASLQANECVERLRTDPNNVAAREKLARLAAENLGQARMAVDQIQLLLGMANQPPGRRAEWLSLKAAWQIRYLQDAEGARKSLEELAREYPQTPQAFAARHRLEKMARTGG